MNIGNIYKTAVNFSNYYINNKLKINFILK